MEIQRIKPAVAAKSTRFTLKTKDYTKQFSHLYSTRLKIYNEVLLDQIRARWGKKVHCPLNLAFNFFHLLAGDKIPIKRLHELNEKDPETCIIVGTVFKQQVMKPSILKEISEEQQMKPQPRREDYTDDSDKLILEDDIQRIRLVGKVPAEELVTGVVLAAKGKSWGLFGNSDI